MRHAANEAEGLCPNGCAPIEPVYVDEAMAREFPDMKVGEKVAGAERCPACGYFGLRTTIGGCS